MNEDVTPVEAVDPNADLIGFRFKAEDLGEVEVVGTPRWSERNYVEVRTVDNDEKVVARTCRLASLVRARKLAEEDDGA